MDRENLRMVKEAEVYLAAAKAWLEELEGMVKNCTDPKEKEKLLNALEQDRFVFSRMMADVVIFKANYGIFTYPENIKRIK